MMFHFEVHLLLDRQVGACVCFYVVSCVWTPWNIRFLASSWIGVRSKKVCGSFCRDGFCLKVKTELILSYRIKH